MKILEFKKFSVLDEVVDALTRPTDDPLAEAMVIGKRESGVYFSFMTRTDNIPETIGYLEAIKTDLALEMISRAERDND